MVRLEIIATTQSAMLVAARWTAQVGFVVPSLDYIPGTALRGALAMQYLRQPEGQADGAFKALLCSDKVRFENLYPLVEGVYWARPIPHSARTCKGYSGFLEDEWDKGRCCHGVSDYLLEEMSDACLQCEAPLEPMDGCYLVKGAGYYQSAEVAKRLYVHTEIEDETGRPREGILFARESISDESRFVGSILSTDELLLNSLLDTVFQKTGEDLWCTSLKVGQARSRGWGTVALEGSKKDISKFYGDQLPSLWERIAAFNNLANQDVSSVQSVDDAVKWLGDQATGQKFCFSLTLWSDIVALDQWLRPVAALTADFLRDEYDLVVNGIGFSMVRGYGSTRVVVGWNTAHGLPKGDDLAIKAGSAFLYEATYNATQLDGLKTFLLALGRLETEGLGFRRNEGFGRVVICDPFHLEVKELRGQP